MPQLCSSLTIRRSTIRHVVLETRLDRPAITAASLVLTCSPAKRWKYKGAETEFRVGDVLMLSSGQRPVQWIQNVSRRTPRARGRRNTRCRRRTGWSGLSPGADTPQPEANHAAEEARRRYRRARGSHTGSERGRRGQVGTLVAPCRMSSRRKEDLAVVPIPPTTSRDVRYTHSSVLSLFTESMLKWARSEHVSHHARGVGGRLSFVLIGHLGERRRPTATPA